jgi:hypothetical protein
MRVSSLASIRGLAGMSAQGGTGDGQQPWAGGRGAPVPPARSGPGRAATQVQAGGEEEGEEEKG